jgi:transposase InsO family protein
VVHRELNNRNIVVSLSTVKRTIDRYGLTKKKSPWKRPYISIDRPMAEKPGVLLQIDTIHFIESDGRRFYAYTIIDLNSRWGYAKLYDHINPRNSYLFILAAMAHAPFSFSMIQSDNGQEFSKGLTFHLNQLNIQHRHSRVRKPNDNAHIERFNRTLKDECFGLRPKHYEKYQPLIEPYLEYYNNQRLHLGLNLETPAQVLQRS